MSTPEDPTHEGQGEPEPQAEFQHLDSPAFPREVAGAVAGEKAKLATWVTGYMEPTWVYEPSSRRPWCVRWQEHPDAVSMLHATYRAYQELIDTEQAGLASPSTWIHHHLLPALNYLRNPDGPFTRCIRSPGQHEHHLPDPVRHSEDSDA